jgi:hypothetical protein
MANATFTVNGSALVAPHVVTYGSTVNLALQSLTDVRSIEWTVDSSSMSGEPLPTITPAGVPLGATASFTVPSNPGDGIGRSWVIKCRVGSMTSGTYATEFRVAGAANGAGFLPVSAGEQNYRNATHGWAEEFNQALAGVTADVSQNTKSPARVATTANITLSGAQTIAGVAVIAGNRVLVKDQTTGSQNGVYVAADPGAWSRASDFDADSDAASGCLVPVAEGTTAGVWQLSTPAPITLGTTALAFTQIQGSGSTAVPPVRAVATANTTLSGAQTVDGVVLANGNRVAITGQSSGSQNGIYVVSTSGAWSRSTEFATATQMQALSGVTFTVLEGTRANCLITFKTTGAITVGTTTLEFSVGISGTTAANAGKFPRVNSTGDNFDYVSSAGTVTARAVLITNVSHSGTLTYDGFSITAGMTVLDIAATSAATRGLWTVQSGAWTRPTETQSPGMVVTISDGNYGRGKQFQMSASSPFTLDTTTQTWERTDGGAKAGKTNTATTTQTLIRSIELPRGKYWTYDITIKAVRLSDDDQNIWRATVGGKTLADGTTTHKTPQLQTVDGDPPLGEPSFGNGTAVLNVYAEPSTTTSTDWYCSYWLSDTD